MVNEVESILNEIRERVRAEEETSAPVGLLAPHERTAIVEVHTNDGSHDVESLARLSAHLTTTARAWDHLPPIFSNRRGTSARLELWIKAKLKSLTRWFTWEQVNFNAAAHHALTETLAALTAHEQQLITIQNADASRRLKLKEIDGELQKLRAGLETQALAQGSAMEEMNAAAARISNMLSDLANESRAGLSKLAREANDQVAGLATDLREEQRVCFKQLSLEASEAAVLEDRGRRAIESRLDKLEKKRLSDEK